MPNSIFVEADRRRMLERIRSLKPEAERQWGTLELPKALCHMADQLLLALGEIEVKPVPTPAALPVLRTVLVRYMPFPKGVRTAPELLRSDAEDLDQARERLLGVIERVVEKGPSARFEAHPLFGRLSGSDWGVLMDRHMDHHLRQFGV